MKLYRISYKVDVVVAAESAADAIQTAEQYVPHAVSNGCVLQIVDGEEIIKKRDLPRAWNGNCVPYGAPNFETIDQLLQQQKDKK